MILENITLLYMKYKFCHKYVLNNYKYMFLFVFVIFLIYIVIFSVPTQEKFESKPKLGFIITRHVNSEKTNELWKTCIKQIKKHYPEETIIIIDSNPNREFLNNKDVNLDNCIVIDSEYDQRGFLLPYYYFYKNEWFDRAIVIHDSVMMNNKINIENIESVKFLWHFTPDSPYLSDLIKKILSNLNNSKELIETYKDEKKWKGCFGCMSVIDYSFLKYIFEKYNMVTLLDNVKCMQDRESFERIFGVICCYEKNELNLTPSIFGNYTDKINNRKSLSYTYDDYLEDVNNNKNNSDINKLFFHR